jgi:hypothetical protein
MSTVARRLDRTAAYGRQALPVGGCYGVRALLSGAVGSAWAFKPSAGGSSVLASRHLIIPSDRDTVSFAHALSSPAASVLRYRPLNFFLGLSQLLPSALLALTSLIWV